MSQWAPLKYEVGTGALTFNRHVHDQVAQQIGRVSQLAPRAEPTDAACP